MTRLDRCALCGKPVDCSQGWLRIGPHQHKLLVRLYFHYECAERVAALVRGTHGLSRTDKGEPL